MILQKGIKSGQGRRNFESWGCLALWLGTRPHREALAICCENNPVFYNINQFRVAPKLNPLYKNMESLLLLDDGIFYEDESLTDRMRRQAPRFDMTNASLTAICGNPPISVHFQDDEASSHETIMFKTLVALLKVPNADYVGVY